MCKKRDKQEDITFIAVDDACVGMRRGEEYDFDLPEAVDNNVQSESCDAEWSVDVSTCSSQIDLYGIIVAFSYNSVFVKKTPIIISIVVYLFPLDGS